MVDYNQDDRDGRYVSLAGRKSQSEGLVSHGGHSLTIAFGGVLIIPANGARVFAVVRNMTDADGATPTDFTITLGDKADADQTVLMRPGDVFVIDKHHPWTGPVTGGCQLGVTSGADWYEVSVK